MEKLYIFKTSANKLVIKFLVFAVFFIAGHLASYSQVAVDFEPRTSVYTVKGDFTMLGNTNLTLVNYNDNGSENSRTEFENGKGRWAAISEPETVKAKGEKFPEEGSD